MHTLTYTYPSICERMSDTSGPYTCNVARIFFESLQLCVYAHTCTQACIYLSYFYLIFIGSIGTECPHCVCVSAVHGLYTSRFQAQQRATTNDFFFNQTPHQSLKSKISAMSRSCCHELVVPPRTRVRGFTIFPNQFLFYPFSRSQFFPNCTADPTWGDIFEYCFIAQSSKLEILFSLKRVKREIRALNFELSKMSPHMWDWLEGTGTPYYPLHTIKFISEFDMPFLC